MLRNGCLILILLALFLPLSAPGAGQRPGTERPVAYWEGKIRVEKTYSDTVGEYRWLGEYRVLLAEASRVSHTYFEYPRKVSFSELYPIELDYVVEADQRLNEGCFKDPDDEIVAGRASGRLRLNSPNRRTNIVSRKDKDARSYKRLTGVVFHDVEELPLKQGQVELPKKLSYEPDNFEYWRACRLVDSRSMGIRAVPNSYTIRIDLLTNMDVVDGWPSDETLSLFEGIKSTGQGLKRRPSEKFRFLNTSAAEIVTFHICGIFKPDDETITGSHTFSSRHLLGDTWTCTGANEPKTLKMSWNLRRKKSAAGEDSRRPSPSETTGGIPERRSGPVPADLRLTVRGVSSGTGRARRIVYTITISNEGPGKAFGTVLTNVLPPAASFLTATPDQGACRASGEITCKLGDLESGGSSKIVIVAALAQRGSHVNRSRVASAVPDPDLKNNSSVTTTPIR